ncbi:hypothetical protein [Candidatus Ichthyocystis hellenicum]|uniref:hypothetical protein n=1 Tax=Candidatus Ichthyocystis hellenicum TaxID=1561003 RepID=UPI000B836F0A|nr:hypothetical protein [Candidatus Ichthyocystis hellenicum]
MDKMTDKNQPSSSCANCQGGDDGQEPEPSALSPLSTSVDMETAILLPESESEDEETSALLPESASVDMETAVLLPESASVDMEAAVLLPASASGSEGEGGLCEVVCETTSSNRRRLPSVRHIVRELCASSSPLNCAGFIMASFFLATSITFVGAYFVVPLFLEKEEDIEEVHALCLSHAAMYFCLALGVALSSRSVRRLLTGRPLEDSSKKHSPSKNL